jgi:hypothetical protein
MHHTHENDHSYRNMLLHSVGELIEINGKFKANYKHMDERVQESGF